jgi:hypothetical protein
MFKNLLLTTAIALIIAGCATSGYESDDNQSTAENETAATVVADDLRINCGAFEDITDAAGNTWKADQAFEDGAWGYVGGATIGRPYTEVKGTEDDAVYHDERYLMEAYRIPVKNGTYTVRLHFADNYEGITDKGQRVFAVSIEGKAFLEDFDIFAEVGATTALIKESKVKVTDGELSIEFAPKVENAMVNGIEILR